MLAFLLPSRLPMLAFLLPSRLHLVFWVFFLLFLLFLLLHLLFHLFLHLPILALLLLSVERTNRPLALLLLCSLPFSDDPLTFELLLLPTYALRLALLLASTLRLLLLLCSFPFLTNINYRLLDFDPSHLCIPLFLHPFSVSRFRMTALLSMTHSLPFGNTYNTLLILFSLFDIA